MRFSKSDCSDSRQVSRAWFAVYTKHQHEKKTAELLASKGIEVFLPLYQTTRRWKDRNKVLALPLFPSYLFLNSGLQNKSEILATPGVFSLVESAGRACPIPDLEIEAIRKIVHRQTPVEPHPFLQSGDTVLVKSGPLAGVSGILVQFRNQYRIVLSVNLLQRSLAIEIDLSSIEKSGEMQNRKWFPDFGKKTA
ncbi:MAG TPA: UpxY family transcription antiterminator [Candidatus Acidoferrum sp.]|jgi:transcription antitermination factor NusG